LGCIAIYDLIVKIDSLHCTVLKAICQLVFIQIYFSNPNYNLLLCNPVFTSDNCEPVHIVKHIQETIRQSLSLTTYRSALPIFTASGQSTQLDPSAKCALYAASNPV